MTPQGIKNIIFDMGNVIIDIDPPRTANKLSILTGLAVEDIRQRIKAADLFHQYEGGHINDDTFREVCREILQTPLSDAQLDEAWHDLLEELLPERLRLIQALGERYNIYLLSNTNNIHLTEIDRRCRQLIGLPYASLFKQLFLSFEINLMKPNIALYEHVLAVSGMVPAESVFLDDVAENLEPARQLGMHTIQVVRPTSILEYLANW
jgi:glucose-1-phosphatase